MIEAQLGKSRVGFFNITMVDKRLRGLPCNGFQHHRWHMICSFFVMKLTVLISFLLTAFTLATQAADKTNAAPKAVDATNEVVTAKDPGINFTNSVNMELVKVPGGFWAGRYEVTQAQYEKVTGSNPSAFQGTNQPVENINWLDAVEF